MSSIQQYKDYNKRLKSEIKEQRAENERIEAILDRTKENLKKTEENLKETQDKFFDLILEKDRKSIWQWKIFKWIRI